MRRENIYKFLYFLAILLVIGFVVRLGVDCYRYNTISNSVPFYAFVIERIIEFIIPSIIIFIIASVVKKKYKK